MTKCAECRQGRYTGFDNASDVRDLEIVNRKTLKSCTAPASAQLAIRTAEHPYSHQTIKWNNIFLQETWYKNEGFDFVYPASLERRTDDGVKQVRPAHGHAQAGGQGYVAEVHVQVIVGRLVVHVHAQLVRLHAVILRYGLQHRVARTRSRSMYYEELPLRGEVAKLLRFYCYKTPGQVSK